jgi:phage-related protein
VSEPLTFINPLDEEVALVGSANAEALWAPTGRFMPPIEFVEEETADREGARIRRTKVMPREIAVPVLFTGTTPSDLRQQMRAITRKMYPALGDGRLVCTAPDGEVREVVCRYRDGLQGDETTNDSGQLTTMGLLVFRAAEDPFWRAQTPTEESFTSGTPPEFFPIFPLVLAASSLFGDITLTNDGDVEAWPVWTITGHGSGLALTYAATGERLSMSTVLGDGETIVIDTRPGVKTLTKNDGSNLWPDFDPTGSLFAFQPGPITVTVYLVDSTEDSSVAVSFRPRYLTP